MKPLRSYSGSTMDIDVFKEPSADAYGFAHFKGVDTISVFDAKEHLRDVVPDKGRMLQLQAYISDYVLKQAGVRTNILGFIEPNIIEMELVRTLPKEKVNPNQTCYLVDGEFIFRYLLNEDSSVVKNFNKGKITLEQLAWSEFPKTDVMLDEPVFNITHKFLKGDPYYDLSNNFSELKECCGFSDADIKTVWDYQRTGNAALRDYASKLLWTLVDGKNEVSIGPNREIKFADFSLTQDGYRINIPIKNKPVKMNKQFVRDYEQWINHDWFLELEQCKSDKVPFSEWPDAPWLKREAIAVFSDMYKAFTKVYAEPVVDVLFFRVNPVKDAKTIEEVAFELEPLQAEINECKKTFL